MFEAKDAQVLLIDFQGVFAKVVPDFAQAADATRLGLAVFNELKLPLTVTEQYPEGLGGTHEGLRDLIADAASFAKTSFSVAGNELIRAHLESLGRDRILMMGIETPVCVLRSALDLKRLGYRVTVLADCVAARRRLDHDLALKTLSKAGVDVSTVETEIYRLLGDGRHPSMKFVTRAVRARGDGPLS